MLARLRQERRLSETMAEYISNTLPPPAPAPHSHRRRPRRAAIDGAAGRNGDRLGSRRNLRSRAGFPKWPNGRAGEQWVFDAEREKLDRLGRRDLADSVVWVANDLGDGAGYDIASFLNDGTPRHIEVKTTNLGARTPFYVTRWEVEVSRKESDIYSLYRVFDFRSDPGLPTRRLRRKVGSPRAERVRGCAPLSERSRRPGERDGVNNMSAVLRLPAWHSRTRPAVARSPKRKAPR